jgi:hypothetical protein
MFQETCHSRLALSGAKDCDQRETILGIECCCSEAFSSGEGDAEMVALARR